MIKSNIDIIGDGGSAGGGVDENAVHVNEANEISGVTEKATPATNDLILIEDSEAGFIKKSVLFSKFAGSAIWGAITGTLANQTDLDNRFSALEDQIEIYEIFELISSGTSGAITKPTGSAILLNRYYEAGDCLIVRADSNNRPIDDVARESDGTPITSTLDVSGNYVFSGTPDAYPVCLVYQVSIARVNRTNISTAQLVDKFELYEADEIQVDSSGFSGNLSTTDIEVQEALNTIDGLALAYTTDKLDVFAPTTSAELAGVISDETGTGFLVFGTNPVLTTPNIGTPSAGTLTNCLGLPDEGVDIDVIGSPTNDNLNLALRDLFSAGAEADGVTYITDAGGATIDIAAGKGYIRSTDSSTGAIFSFEWAASSGVSIPTDTRRYVGVEYNAGSPQVSVRTTQNWNRHTDFELGEVVNESDTLHIFNNPDLYNDSINNTIHRFFETERIVRSEREGGLALAETGTRNITVSASVLFDKLNEFAISALDTSASDTFDSYSSSGLESSGNTQWDNDNYDNAGTLTTLSLNKYANLWFYVCADGCLSCIYGTAEYVSSAGAEAEGVPVVLPDRLVSQALLIGRIIFKKGESTATSIQSAFDVSFVSSLASDHNNLANLELAASTVTWGHIDDQTQTIAGAKTFSNTVTVTDGGVIDTDGIDLVTGNDYQINNVSVLNATTLGSSVVNSSLTSFGTVTSGTLSTGAVLAGVTMTLGSDADGDIYYRSSNVLTRLPKGTAEQVLNMNAGATAPEWSTIYDGLSKITVGTTQPTSPNTGDLWVDTN